MTGQRWLVVVVLLCVLAVTIPAGATSADSHGDSWEWTVTEPNATVWDHTASPDGEFVYAALTVDTDSDGDEDEIRLLKVSDSGERQWVKTVEPVQERIVPGVYVASDRVVLDVFSAKTDKRRYLTFSPAGERLAEQGPTNREVFSLFSPITYNETDQGSVQKLRGDGGIHWETEEYEDVWDVATLEDGGLMLATDSVIARYGPDGELLWERQSPPYFELVRWNDRFLAVSDETIWLITRDGGVIAKFDGQETDVLGVTPNAAYLQVEESVRKIDADGNVLWTHQGDADYQNMRVDEGYVYLTGPPDSDTSPAADNTTVITVLGTDAGQPVYQQQLTHPDLGDFMYGNGAPIVEITSDDGVLVSNLGFGIAKLDATGDLEWHISENDAHYWDNESAKRPHQLGQLDHRITDTNEVIEKSDRYLLLRSGSATVVSKSGTVLRRDATFTDAVATEPVRVNSGLVYPIEGGLGHLAAESLVELPAQDHAEDGFLDPILDPVVGFVSGYIGGGEPTPSDPQPVVSGPGENVSGITFNESQDAASPGGTSVETFGHSVVQFLVRMFSIQGLIMVGVTVIAVLLVRTWPDDGNGR